jgi:hypothetical protein
MRILTALLLVLAVAAAWGILSRGDATADSVYNPATTVRICNALPPGFSSTDPSLAGTGPTCTETLTAGTATDYTTILDLPSGNLNFSQVVTFSPNAPTSVATGTKVGGLRSLTNLGLINNPCSTALTVDFIAYNVALPNGATRATMTNIAWPKAPGVVDRFGRWKTGDGVHTSNPPLPTDPDWAVDGPPDEIIVTSNGTNADGVTLSIQNYPIHLLDAFDPDFVPGVGDGSAEPKVPLAAYGGLTLVSGNWIPLYFVVFDAGQLAASPATPGALGDMEAEMGYPSVSVLNDPTAVIASPSSITDFCTSLNVTTMLRSTVHSNPAAGTRMFLQYNASLRDTDQDGHENAIDTCPYNAAPAENPRNALGVNDTDSDGIMNSCDANTPAASGADVDADGFQNRQDNCPQVANSTNVESELGVDPVDKGPRTDSIGDACDGAEGGNPLGSGSITITQNGSPITIALSDTVGNGRYMIKTNVVPKCFSGTDADGDGYCTFGGVTTDNADSGACAVTGTPSGYSGTWIANACFFRHTLWSGASHPANQQDSDGDTITGTPTSFFTDAIETYLGTDPTKPCAATRAPGNANNEGPLDHWPLDFDDNGTVGIGDYLKYNTVLSSANGGNRAINQGGNGDGAIQTIATITGAALGGTFPQNRYDLNLDGFLSTADLGKFSQYMTKACGVAGAAPIFPNGGAIFQQ